MNFIPISEEQLYGRLNTPFNPPAIGSEEDEEAFANEWHDVRRRLKTVLDQFGENSLYGEADYVLGETLTLSRGIGFELTSDRMFTPELIHKLQELLKGLPESYEFDLVTYSEDGAGHVFVNAHEIQACCREEDLKQFGCIAPSA